VHICDCISSCINVMHQMTDNARLTALFQDNLDFNEARDDGVAVTSTGPYTA